MYLQSLEINGFKSFAKKGSFSFNSRISGIVGPNGSGKSNVAEAFRFVLGEQSLKNMRSKKGTDLLFAGQNGQVNRASVAVTFDNKNRLMDIDYKTVTVERVLSRDGSNEYLINGNKVRAKDVTELLASANVGSTGHHIISQGEADKILMINARDRRQVIEDALGLKVFTIKKNEAERKLIKVGENLAEVKIQERTITPRIAYLKREVEKIEKTRAMREELRDLYKQYLPGKQQVVQTIETINTAIAEQEKQINGIDQQINALRAEQQNAASDAGRAEKQKQLHDQKDVVNGIRTQRREHERNLGRIDAEISALEQQKREVELFNEQLESAGSTATERADTLSAEMHKTWMAWAQEIMDSENLSSERVTRWKNMMVDYAQLSDSDKQKDRNHVNNILAALGEEIVQAKTFDDRMISGKQNERVQIETQIIELQSREQTEQQTLDEFELEMGSPEVAVQKIQIQILEHEKQLGSVHAELRQKQSNLQQQQTLMQQFDTEMVFANDLFGQESQSFAQNQTGQVDLNLREKIVRIRILLENAGSVSGEEVMTEYKDLVARREYVAEQTIDLTTSSESLQTLIKDLDVQIEERFRAGMEKINTSSHGWPRNRQ